MARNTLANDWQFAGIASLSASVGIVTGGWIFSFRSQKANIWEDYILIGGGTAPPGFSAEVSLPDFASDDLGWSNIQCQSPFREFAADQLDGAFAEFTNDGVGAAFVGYSTLFLTVYSKSKAPFFSRQRNDGYSAGIEFKPGYSKSFVMGYMKSIGTIAKDYIVPVVNWACYSIGAGSGLVMAGDALLAGRGISIALVFVEGYARMLAECTDSGSWKIGEAEQSWYSNHMWEATVNSCGKIMKAKGSRSPVGIFDDARKAGEASIFQAMDYLYEFRGAEYYEALCKLHRNLYGENKELRRKRYEQILEQQVRDGKTAGKLGILLTV